MKYVELVSIVDFLYYGEANVFQEDLDLFLSIAEELQLKGFECSNAEEDWKGREKSKQERSHKMQNANRAFHEKPVREYVKPVHENTLATPSTTHLSGDLIELDEKIKSKME